MLSYLNKINQFETLAAVDLGSNALRAVIARKSGDRVEIIKSFREPLRLGEDVFLTGEISQQKMQKTEEAFIKLFHIFTEYNVTDIRAMATSAMRESKNGHELARRIAFSTGIELETIKGKKEAQVIFEAVNKELNLKKKNALIMDIGGGSTEFILVKDGKIKAIKSFKIGTVRLLNLSSHELEIKINQQTDRVLDFVKQHLKIKQINHFIGTGGNLRRIGKIRKKMLVKSSSEIALFNEISHMEEAILSMSYVDRIRRLELDQNRADVILPAIMLTHHLMAKLKKPKILLPRVGLKEGIILSMLPKVPKTFIIKD